MKQGSSAGAEPPTDRAADRVVAVLERRIYSGELHDGQMFPSEREIIGEFSVSRTVAREAVKILVGRGLLEDRPRHRPIVRKPGYGTVTNVLGGLVQHLIGQPGGVGQIFEVRIFVEAGLVRLAATDATKDDIRHLREALNRNWDCIEDSEAFYESDKDFHAVFYTIPGNPVFPAIHHSFCDWLDGHWRMMPRLPERNRRNFEAHESILNAILERDPDQAERLLRSHLNDAWLQVKDTFKDL
ncbi:FCD domain-containing protein [Sedimentitalea todarodis]|nr:FCD domain-containing protein [Sedimentitalea todarodis]